MLLPELESKPGCRFSNNLNQLDEGEREHTIGIKILPLLSFCKGNSLLGCIQHVVNSYGILTRHIAQQPTP